MIKSILCTSKDHKKCQEKHCECSCHHTSDCNCFACRIRTISFGDVPGGYKSNNPSTSNKLEDF
jgi:hypothetical protein